MTNKYDLLSHMYVLTIWHFTIEWGGKNYYNLPSKMCKKKNKNTQIVYGFHDVVTVSSSAMSSIRSLSLITNVILSHSITMSASKCKQEKKAKVKHKWMENQTN